MAVITQHSEGGSLIKLKVLTMPAGEREKKRTAFFRYLNQISMTSQLAHACNFRHNSQQLPDWPKDKEKLSVCALAKKFSIPYTTLYK